MLSFITAALVALSAAASPGVPAGDADCATCHEQAAAGFTHTAHARIRGFETPDGVTGCASCHGDTARHLETGEVEGLRTFGDDADADSEACLGCHATRGMGEWKASAHAGEAGCTSCHSSHAASEPEKKCATCHADVQAMMFAPSHHPVKEGRMTCASCHNVHAANTGALKTVERTNDLCLTCHAAQQGPFIFQHEPVEEDCMICHQPHGSTANNLLVANEPFLCLQCHELHFHTGYRAWTGTESVTVGGKAYPNVMGANGYQKAFGTKCTQCHIRVHGSDLPSSSVPGQGDGLTR
jgi:DmsE family decaheme c-type cytochrome